jgi:hypothetical protein
MSQIAPEQLDLLLLEDTIWVLVGKVDLPSYDFALTDFFACRRPWQRPDRIQAIGRFSVATNYAHLNFGHFGGGGNLSARDNIGRLTTIGVELRKSPPSTSPAPPQRASICHLSRSMSPKRSRVSGSLSSATTHKRAAMGRPPRLDCGKI